MHVRIKHTFPNRNSCNQNNSFRSAGNANARPFRFSHSPLTFYHVACSTSCTSSHPSLIVFLLFIRRLFRACSPHSSVCSRLPMFVCPVSLPMPGLSGELSTPRGEPPPPPLPEPLPFLSALPLPVRVAGVNSSSGVRSGEQYWREQTV